MKNETSWKVHSWTLWDRAVKANTAELQRGGERRSFEAELATDLDLKTTTLFFYGLEGIKRGEESCSPPGI